MARILAVIVAAAVLAQAQSPEPRNQPVVPLEEATIVQLQEWMRAGRYTSRQLTDAYLDRIDAIDRRGPTLRAIIEINPDARPAAAALDRERRDKGPRRPPH